MDYGLIIKEAPDLDPRLWRFGSLSGLSKNPLRPDRDWSQFLPVIEYQNLGGFDRLACVTYSALNCLETLHKAKTGEELNRSDRFTAKLSGTTRYGNDFESVAKSISKTDGTVPEDAWPDVLTSWEDYYADVPEAIKEIGQKFLERWKVSYEYVPTDPDSLWEALQCAPIQVCLYAYGPTENGLVQRVETKANHAVMLMRAEYGKWWEVFDHYSWKTRKLAWDTRFWGATRYDIEPTSQENPMYQFKPDTMYFVTEGKGEEFALLAGLLRHDDPNKLARQVAYRNGGKIEGRYLTVSLKELEGWDAYDLKGNLKGKALDIAK